jgi:hypothetical protein
MHLVKPLRIAFVIGMLAAAPLTAQFALKAAPAARPLAAAATTVNCLLASNIFAQKEADPKAKALAQQTLYFYLGRLDPRITAPQLKLDLKRSADSLKGVNAAPLMNACLRELQAKGQMLQSVGQQLQQRR